MQITHKKKMSDIEFDLRFKYLECDLADERIESKPVLCVFFDAHFIRSDAGGGIRVTPLDEKNLGKRYRCTLKANVRDNRVPATARIGLASFAMRRNDNGMSCYTTAGANSVAIQDMLAPGFVRNVDMLIDASRMIGPPVKKGVIQLRVTGVRIGSHIQVIDARHCALGGSITESHAQLISAFIDQRAKSERALRETWPQVENVRVPMCLSNEGIALLGGCFVPIEGFVMSEPIVVGTGYWENAYKLVMQRRNMNPYTDFKHLDAYHQAEIMADMASTYAQALDYISDTVVTSVRQPSGKKIGAFYGDQVAVKSLDQFQNAGRSGAGDCEDLTKCIYMFFLSLQAHPFVSSRLPMQQIQAHARCYVPFMMLATVHGAQVNQNEESIGAHLYGLAIPKGQLLRALMRTPAGRQFAETYIGNTYDRYKDTPMPTLRMEGTGRMESMGPGAIVTTVNGEVRAAHVYRESSDPIFEERRYVIQNFRGKEGRRIQIPLDFGQKSDFYLGNLTGLTGEFLGVGAKVGAFTFGTINEKTGEITRGATFVDVINQKENVAIIPWEPVTDRIMEITSACIALEVPSPEYHYDGRPPTQADFPQTDIFERIKASVANLKRTGSSPYGSVDIFIRPHQINNRSANMMIDDLRRMTAVWKVDYAREHYTNEVVGYRLMLYVDQKAIRPSMIKKVTLL